MPDERAPLLQFPGQMGGSESLLLGDHHSQFCQLVGTRPLDHPPDQKHRPHPESLYYRAVRQRSAQKCTYLFTAGLTNTLLLAQVVLGATLTGLAASDTNHIVVTVFGALNTIIAGVIAFLKSRGQPMRARMFRDDLERVVDEIENSAIMWLGISKGAHGYDAIDTDEQVTVRSEVARLTRLYDKTVKTNTLNDPDMYSTGAPGDPHSAALRDKSTQPAPVPAAPPPEPVAGPSAPAAPNTTATAPEDPDASPATKPPEPTKAKDPEAPVQDKPKPAEDQPSSKDVTSTQDKAEGKADPAAPSSGSEGPSQSKDSAQAGPSYTTNTNSQPVPVPQSAPTDPDESPASAAHPQKHTEDTSKADEEKK